jgi:hypothetical protein
MEPQRAAQANARETRVMESPSPERSPEPRRDSLPDGEEGEWKSE